jgi:cell division septation protein DedD
MRRSITSLVLAAVALLVVTASVAAADPFGWGHQGTTYGSPMTHQGTGSSNGWTSPNVAVAPATSVSPASTPRQPVTTVQSQTRRTQTAKPSPSPTSTHHATTRSTQHGSDWCGDYGRHDGRHDDHGSY